MKTKIYVLIALLLVFTGTGFSVVKDMTQADWVKVLGEMNIKPAQTMLDKLVRSTNTLVKVNMQTRGRLTPEEWISIFKKLGLEPKADMQYNEWVLLFKNIGVQAKFEDNNQNQQPAETANTITVSTTQTPTAQQQQTAQNPEITPSPSAPLVPIKQSEQVPVPAAPLNTVQESKPLPPPSVNEPSKAQEQVKSTKISLDLRGMDVLSVLKMISQKTELNIIAGNNVKGSVNIYLKDIDAIDALKMILEMNDLAYVYEDKVIKVMTAQDYEKLYGKAFYARTTVEIVNLKYNKAENIMKTIISLKSKIAQIIPDSASNSIIIIDTPDNIIDLKKIISTIDVPIETKTFALNYTQAKDISDKIKISLTPVIGELQVDERSNQLIIKDTPKKLEELTALISSFDKRHREVLIEARILQVSYSDEIKAGINWENIFSNVQNQNIPGKVVGNFSNLSTLPPVVMGNTGLQLSMGTVEINNFNAVVDMLQTVGNTDLVSSPRIATLENKEAKILVGTKEAYITTQITNPGTTVTNPIVAETVSFVDVGMKLYVTPSIGDNGFITMKIRPEVSSVDRTLTTSQKNVIPIVRTSESETTVMVKDGISIIIAGLIENKVLKKTEGIPFFCRIPLIGPLFSRTTNQKVKSELVVFLTPHLMTGDITNTDDISKDAKKKLKNLDSKTK
ncbi:MAG: hypothetical protein A3J83_08775 [Elusimicrobia bacterium RIFOXYA2_FULL_40_6]|nr:MAG: hypothetical protein A3J83_08775 [Elusimicrobia bacterium RIFOXYA2_FULL_40_6]